MHFANRIPQNELLKRTYIWSHWNEKLSAAETIANKIQRMNNRIEKVIGKYSLNVRAQNEYRRFYCGSKEIYSIHYRYDLYGKILFCRRKALYCKTNKYSWGSVCSARCCWAVKKITKPHSNRTHNDAASVLLKILLSYL